VKGRTIDGNAIIGHASPGVRRLNPALFAGRVPGAAAPDLERGSGHAPAGTDAGQGGDPRYRVTVRSYRAGLQPDPDGLCVKWAVDGLVIAGAIPDDSARYVESVTVRSLRVETRAEERTEIEVEEVA
jgi:hypothetical protein